MPKSPKKTDWVFILSMVCLVVLAGETLIFYEKITEAQYSRDAMQKKEEETRQQKRELAERVEYQNKYIDRLLKDSEFYKMELRQRLGAVEHGEIVIREEGSDTNAGEKRGGNR